MGMVTSKRFRRFFDDPSRGLEYNRFLMNRRISGAVYAVDIARTPMVIRDDLVRADVQDEAGRANAERYMVDKRVGKLKGRQ